MVFLFKKQGKKKSVKQRKLERGKPPVTERLQKPPAPSRTKKASDRAASGSSTPVDALQKTLSEIASLTDSGTLGDGDSLAPAKPKTKRQKTRTPRKARRAKDIKFKTSAAGRPSDSTDTDLDIEKARILVREVFAAGAPVQSKNYLAGRLLELEKIISAIEDKRDHVIVYGPRGWGKSSVVNSLAEIAREAGYLVVQASCGAYASYSQMFRSFLAEIPLLYDRDVVSKRPVAELSAEFDELLPEGEYSAKELTDVMERLTSTRVIMILDEYDRIRNNEFKLAITETIKNFSDRSIRAQLVIVGVADTLDHLIGINPSIRRNISGVQMKLLSNGEVEQLILIGQEITGISFSASAQKKVINLSRGNPYSAKLLLLHAARSALEQQCLEVHNSDVLSAARRVANDSEALIPPKLLETLSGSGSEAQQRILLTLANADTDRFDRSSIVDISRAMAGTFGASASPLSIGKRVAHFTRKPAPLLMSQKLAGRTYYSFVDTMVAFYLRLISSLENGR